MWALGVCRADGRRSDGARPFTEHVHSALSSAPGTFASTLSLTWSNDPVFQTENPRLTEQGRPQQKALEQDQSPSQPTPKLPGCPEGLGWASSGHSPPAPSPDRPGGSRPHGQGLGPGGSETTKRAARQPPRAALTQACPGLAVASWGFTTGTPGRWGLRKVGGGCPLPSLPPCALTLTRTYAEALAAAHRPPASVQTPGGFRTDGHVGGSWDSGAPSCRTWKEQEGHVLLPPAPGTGSGGATSGPSSRSPFRTNPGGAGARWAGVGGGGPPCAPRGPAAAGGALASRPQQEPRGAWHGAGR